MESKVNFIRGRSSLAAKQTPVEKDEGPVSVESFCAPSSYYVNQDVFCNLKPRPVPEDEQKCKIYTKEL